MTRAIEWDWKPLVSVGPIRFGGESAELSVVPGMRLESLTRDGDQLDSYFKSEKEGVTVICVDRRVVSTGFHERFFHEGVNLIGMPEAEVRMRFRNQEIVVGDFPDGHTLEMSELGLELTIRDGRVLIASAFGTPFTGG